MARSVIDIPDLTMEELDRLMDTAEDIIAHPDDYADACRRKKLATLLQAVVRPRQTIIPKNIMTLLRIDLNS